MTSLGENVLIFSVHKGVSDLDRRAGRHSLPEHAQPIAVSICKEKSLGAVPWCVPDPGPYFRNPRAAKLMQFSEGRGQIVLGGTNSVR